jgi:mannosyltransferase OCH1-like enzyme
VSAIPKQFFRIWLGPKPLKPLFQSWWQRFYELHPSWKLTTITSGEPYVDGELKEVYQFCSTYSERSDILRYAILYRFGGVYVDFDVFPVKPFDQLMDEPTPFLCWQTKTNLETAVVGSPPGHPALKAVMDFLPKHYWDHAQESPHYTTGPAAVSKVLVQRDDVRKLPKSAFMPFGRCNEKEFMVKCLRSDAYAGHFAAGTWWAEAKRRRETGRRAEI